MKENKKLNSEQKYILNCNEKCESKSKKNEAKNESLIENHQEKKRTNKKNLVYFILGFLILVLSITIYFFFNDIFINM